MGRDAITGLAVLAASLVLFWATLGLERHPMVPVGPGFYPRIVLGLTAGFALLLVVFDVLSRRRHPRAEEEESEAPVNYALVLTTFAIFGAYVVTLPYLGFRLATAAFLIAMPAAIEPPRHARRWATVIVVALVATAVTYYVFEGYLHVLLPRGRWTGF